MRGQLRRENERLMSFDRLTPNYKTRDFGCVTRDELGYHMKYVPPTLMVSETSVNHYAETDRWAAAIDSAFDMPSARKDFLRAEIERLPASEPRRIAGFPVRTYRWY
jgi:hypothetical protein